MSTSGSIDFQSTLDQIISDALAKIQVLGAAESVSGEDSALCKRELNRMLKAWQAKGIILNLQTEGSVFLSSGAESYSLNSSSGAHASNSIVLTELSAASAASDTTLTVDSTTGMTAGDYVGTELDDDTIDWTTIVSVDSATQITITTGIASAASVDNNVYTYTTRMGRPTEITSIRYRDDSDNDRELKKISRSEYFALPDKNSSGEPTLFYYDAQHTTGKLYVWPVADRLDGYLKVTYIRSIEDMDSSANTLDLPQEWEEAVVHNLAVRLGPIFGRTQEARALAPLAQMMLDDLLNYNVEDDMISIVPDISDYA